MPDDLPPNSQPILVSPAAYAAICAIIDGEVPTAWDRDERDACEKGTPGCSVWHTAHALMLNPGVESGCATW